MNKLFYKLLLIGFLIPFCLVGVEERNPLPFYYLTGKPFKIKLNLKSHRLCRVKLSDVIQYKNIELVDCYNLDKNFPRQLNLFTIRMPRKMS